MDAGTKYGIVGKVENPTNATVSLDGLSLRVALSPWAKDALGVWERRQEGLQYRVDCAWIGGSGGVGNLCQNAKVSVENNTATVTLSGGTLCSGCELSGPRTASSSPFTETARNSTQRARLWLRWRALGMRWAMRPTPWRRLMRWGSRERSPWRLRRGSGRRGRLRGSAGLRTNSKWSAGQREMRAAPFATVRTTQNQEAIEVSFNAAGPLEISISSKTGGELDYREPIVTSDGFGSQVELSEDGKEWKITLLAE